ncbi:MAG TPA: hypothetical protein VGJ25_09100 [Gaiellaceae bacterium]|jgi:hypothetical protein
MSADVSAGPERPGFVTHTPQRHAQRGLSLGRLGDLAGGIFGSGVVRALTGQAQSPGVLGAQPAQEYAMQPFGIPGGMEPGQPKQLPDAKKALAAHAHTLLALEESSIKFQRSGRVNSHVPQQLRDALELSQNWTAPR